MSALRPKADIRLESLKRAASETKRSLARYTHQSELHVPGTTIDRKEVAVNATAAVLIMWFTIPAIFQSLASADDKTSVRPNYWIVVNDHADNECVPGYVDLEVTLGPDDRVASAIVLASQPKRIFDSAALKRVQGVNLHGEIVDEDRNLLVRVQFKNSVHRLKQCLGAESSS